MTSTDHIDGHENEGDTIHIRRGRLEDVLATSLAVTASTVNSCGGCAVTYAHVPSVLAGNQELFLEAQSPKVGAVIQWST